MKRPRRLPALLFFAVLVVRFGNSCAYAPDVLVFTLRTDPDAPYARYAAGRLGIVPATYRLRHLVVAYRALTGHTLTPAEQSAAVSVDQHYNPSAAQAPNPAWQTVGPRYVAASSPQVWADGYGPVERLVPGQDFETFDNCLTDAFAHATATLAERRARYGKPGGPDTPEIADWIAGQQAVFSNCGETGQTPAPAPAGAPLWLRQDRAYQTAAARFYNLDYDQALAAFQAIAADAASPWSPLARYLVARVYIRKALLPHNPSPPKPEEFPAEEARVRALLLQARDQLAGILRDPAMQPLHHQSRDLLDFLMVRLDPAQQAAELARRLTANGGDPGYAHDVIDLSYIYNLPPLDTPLPKNPAAKPGMATPLLRWLDDFGWPLPVVSGSDSAPPAAYARADALKNWRRTNGPEWLVAGLSLSQPGDEGVSELFAAARNLPATSSAYATVTYHRLRLEASPGKQVEQMPPTSLGIYTEITALMPGITASQPISTVNQFADLQSSLSPTLDDYLKHATRRAASLMTYDNHLEPYPTQDNPVTLCQVDINAPQTQHLDDVTAVVFNQRLPLRLLREAALSSALPANVRFAVAHMAWTRALLLDDADTARALSPYLAQCQPAFAPWLDDYNRATTTDGRHVLGLLALMRFSSTEPIVRAGLERDFAAYDTFRDNWWCSVGPQQTPEASYLFTQKLVARGLQPDPPFLGAADRGEVNEQLTQLQKIPYASDYFAQQALTWVAQHPDDPHNADVIGFAMRVVRNACRSDATKDLNHRLFDLLQTRYPKSDWAARYTTWE
jgi:hypothetical protein